MRGPDSFPQASEVPHLAQLGLAGGALLRRLRVSRGTPRAWFLGGSGDDGWLYEDEVVAEAHGP